MFIKKNKRNFVYSFNDIINKTGDKKWKRYLLFWNIRRTSKDVF